MYASSDLISIQGYGEMVVFAWSGLTSMLCTIADAIKLSRCKEGEELIVLWPIDGDCGIDVKQVLDMNFYQNMSLKFICFKSAHKSIKEIDIKKSIKRSIIALFNNIYTVCYNS